MSGSAVDVTVPSTAANKEVMARAKKMAQKRQLYSVLSGGDDPSEVSSMVQDIVVIAFVRRRIS